MLKLSRKTLLALEAVIDIAFNARPEPVQAKEITARQGVPQRYLEQVMQQLVRAGILKGVRGPRGGYRLARERRRISVGDVVRIAMSLDDSEESFDGGSELGRRVVVPGAGHVVNLEASERFHQLAMDFLAEQDI